MDEGVLILNASYTDDGKQGTMPRLRGEGNVVKAADALSEALDARKLARSVERLERMRNAAISDQYLTFWE